MPARWPLSEAGMQRALRWFGSCGGLWLVAAPLFGQASPHEHVQRLGVQECDTRCQTAETDCDLACDQVVACVEECKKVSEACTQKCREAPPPSKPEPSSKAPSPPSAAPPIASGKKPPSAKTPAPPKPPPKA